MYKIESKNGQNNVYMQNDLISCEFIYGKSVYYRIDIEVSKSAAGSDTVISKIPKVNPFHIAHI